MRYTLYQVRKEHRREYGFMSLEERQAILGTKDIDLSVYGVTYQSDVDTEHPHAALDYLFHVFNLDHPDDFCSYSMSVGDVVHLGDTWWYCDSSGWTPIHTCRT
ncbi:YodL domain-containing protein [Alicyclobacillus ferrooxydans]|uniref:YodL-like domain-containing protein n=1 Tax=Alicyclobacillus ferrooxydans TaxID=471514 RepID=A0A0P9CZW2_9BACL|nr:YodL domain-containing protein [Alicyclobacillus ferrooxydans]KPV42699.1 hypothetical protein AN477_16350 [Alicyclobacillus ferrooxydans]